MAKRNKNPLVALLNNPKRPRPSSLSGVTYANKPTGNPMAQYARPQGNSTLRPGSAPVTEGGPAPKGVVLPDPRIKRPPAGRTKPRTKPKPGTKPARPTKVGQKPLNLSLPSYDVSRPSYGPLPKWKDLAKDKGYQNEIKGMFEPAARILARSQANAAAARDAYSQEAERFQAYMDQANKNYIAESAASGQKAMDQTNAAVQQITKQAGSDAGATAAAAGDNAAINAAGGLSTSRANAALDRVGDANAVREVNDQRVAQERYMRDKGIENSLRTVDMKAAARKEYFEVIRELNKDGIELTMKQKEALLNDLVRQNDTNRQIQQTNFEGRMSVSEAQRQRGKDQAEWENNRYNARRSNAVDTYNARTEQRNDQRDRNQRNYELRLQGQQARRDRAAEVEVAYAKAQGEAGPDRKEKVEHNRKATASLQKAFGRGGALAGLNEQSMYTDEGRKQLQSFVFSLLSANPYADDKAIVQMVTSQLGKAGNTIVRKHLRNMRELGYRS